MLVGMPKSGFWCVPPPQNSKLSERGLDILNCHTSVRSVFEKSVAQEYPTCHQLRHISKQETTTHRIIRSHVSDLLARMRRMCPNTWQLPMPGTMYIMFFHRCLSLTSMKNFSNTLIRQYRRANIQKIVTNTCKGAFIYYVINFWPILDPPTPKMMM